ncbi:PaaX family transcriptional regulator C-terminal domain-containing protein [Sulfitobacter guttiformis]|uniref:PaaX family transcriptional regulator n=1 Tax=Sulfitobacter guttiformis TaxID=74349 RepID=A0A420DS20_9RHOB|nr:PaaX family transcriptional regulator C-terminal domain-containing protein [Sulfitobacter guttiformis]KIN74356.1 PaaX domain protein [Sulfitobacter guttiformis KCTC 32187]RKE96953.1 PaaX family transcriptional regulator [Sulfitobacter guttiformis]
MHPTPYQQTKAALLALGGQRVWSLMVTLFGDLAQAEGSMIDGPVLSAIMAEMDVRPEAVRVALHRLRNDGWIASEKHGRTGRHALTSTSRKETTLASARIYADPLPPNGEWTLALSEDVGDEVGMAQHGFMPLLPRVYLGTGPAPKNTLALRGGAVPNWLRGEVAPLMLEPEYAALLPALQQVHDVLEESTLTPLQTAVLRCLLVHNWRRIVLRHVALPRDLLPDAWSGHACHTLVDTLLKRFPRPAIDTILPA